MKTFKRIAAAALVLYLLSFVACRKDSVQVIPGGLNQPAGSIETNDKPAEIVYSTNGLAGFTNFPFM